jgi:serine/threonine protein kinase
MTTTAEPREYSPSDFLYGPILGEGRFGSVVYAEHATQVDNECVGEKKHKQKQPQQPHYGQGYAIKMIPKSEILRHNQLQAIMTEKHILSEVLLRKKQDEETSSSSDSAAAAAFMVTKLFCCFHDESYLYFVLELCPGGTMVDLFQHCAKLRQDNSRNDSISDTPFMDKVWIRYYSGQLVRVLEYIHQRGVIHRDVSPRNILFTLRGYMKLCDFGSAVVISATSASEASSSGRINDDFVGTADYVCPEIIRGSISSSSILQRNQLLPAIDLWSLGCLIFQMSVGESPFHAESDQNAFQRVLDYTNQKNGIHFLSYVDKDVKDLILSLLVIDAASRIGISDGVVSSQDSQNLYHSLRKHKFFNEDKLQQFWALLESNSLKPPYRPAEQSWMTQLHQNGRKMKRSDEMYFDL